MEDWRETDVRACDHPARALLDFHLNGSLTGDDDEMVRAHLESCPACTAEVDGMAGIAAAIERHGTRRRGLARDRRTRWAGLAAAAALVIAGALIWFQGRDDRDRGAGPAIAVATVDLDLGAGVLRDGQEPPVVVLGPDTGSVRASFFPPLGAGPGTNVGIVDAAGHAVFADSVLPPRDEVGRVALLIPVASLAREGRYEIVVGAREGEDAFHADAARYPFEVRRPRTAR